MEYRVFRNQEPIPQDDGRPKPFGKRESFADAAALRLTKARLLKALVLGLGLGVLGVMLAPTL